MDKILLLAKRVTISFYIFMKNFSYFINLKKHIKQKNPTKSTLEIVGFYFVWSK